MCEIDVRIFGVGSGWWEDYLERRRSRFQLGSIVVFQVGRRVFFSVWWIRLEERQYRGSRFGVLVLVGDCKVRCWLFFSLLLVFKEGFIKSERLILFVLRKMLVVFQVKWYRECQVGESVFYVSIVVLQWSGQRCRRQVGVISG